MGVTGTGRPGKGVKNEAKAAAGVPRVDSAGPERGDSVEENAVTQACISGDGIYFQVRVEDGELEQQSGGGILLSLIGGQEVVE